MNLVVFVLAVVLKTQPEVGPHLKLVQLGSVDAPPLEFYVEAVLLPSHALPFILFFRKNIRFHSSCEEALVFLEVAYVDRVLQQLLPTLNLEVEPLQVPRSVAIDPHETVILCLSYFYGSI